MSDILPRLTGPKIDKILGKGSVAIITDECLFGLKKMKVNGVDNCIYIVLAESGGCADVHPAMPERHQMKLVKELEEGLDMHAITMPMCHRSERSAWESAANIFDALANAARHQAEKAKP